ncbi:type I-E CRISPR-associated protein Cse2/CasB [Planobispora takensis]|uniref:Type I-E CRISPR-associated protein Cse2/CasB n=1 Tax=Planobispora takensis TaxID=1367882 RepID=A0A8J3T532_9ACTN|nr:type I-E CRISPR-associated protein Cse2/CasB [Planobispora takensis]GII05487.1 type I-E CRISPR-associated protein Cse2/CasB [Planobispora takensis]
MSTQALSTPYDEIRERRRRFIGHLYSLHAKLESGSAHQVSEARRTLAQLRRSLNGPRYEAEAYAAVFPFDPPQVEQQAWILVAGLFALHPQPRSTRSNGSRSLGTSMKILAAERNSAERRFVQLLAVDRASLPHYLRQTIRLLSSEDITLDYYQLLDDVVTLMDERADPERVHRVRLGWARDFHRPTPSVASSPSPAI